MVPPILLQSTDLVLWMFGVMDTLAGGAATLVAPDLDRELNNYSLYQRFGLSAMWAMDTPIIQSTAAESPAKIN